MVGKTKYTIDCDRIREILREQGWTDANLAEKAGLSAKTVRRILSGNNANVSTLQRISDILNEKIFKLEVETEDIPRNRLSIAIIGRGFSGTAVAIRLMQLASVPLQLVIFDQSDIDHFGGFVYGAESLRRNHFLNIHAGRISLFRERPDDFLKWATEDADRDEWKEAIAFQSLPNDQQQIWEQRLSFTEWSAVPRIIYSYYLRDRFHAARSRSSDLLDVKSVKATVTNVAAEQNTVSVEFQETGIDTKTEPFDACVICTGTETSQLPQKFKPVRDAPNVFAHPYSVRFENAMATASARDNLLIVGSGLTAYDAAISAQDAGFSGAITMISRHGLKHEAYPLQHSHQIIPRLFDHHFQDISTAGAMVLAIAKCIEEAHDRFPRLFPDESLRIVPERVLKAVEPNIAEFVQQASQSEVRRFIEQHQSWLTTKRTSVVPEVAERLKSSKLELESGDITEISRSEDGFVAAWNDLNGRAGKSSPKKFSRIVLCTGFGGDYTKASGIWKSLMRQLLSNIGKPVSALKLAVTANCSLRITYRRRYSTLLGQCGKGMRFNAAVALAVFASA